MNKEVVLQSGKTNRYYIYFLQINEIVSALTYNAVQGETITMQFRIKRKENWFFSIVNGNATSPIAFRINAYTGEIILKSGTALDYSDVVVFDEYLLVAFKITSVSTTSGGRVNVEYYDNDNFLSYDYGVSESFKTTAHQLEALPYATSYIPNFGNSAGQTRGADSLTNFGSEHIIDSESGILFFEGSALKGGITESTRSLSRQ